MRNSKQETISDIVAALRAVAYIQTAESPRDVLEFANRIEAAAKREREAGAEAAQICGEIGEIVGRDAACHQPVTDCHGLNAAAMREALKKVRIVLHCAIVADILKGDDVNSAFNEVTAALSAPPRNCDVGTTKEQSARFDAHCRKNMGCLTCPLREKDGGVQKHCEFAWSQMPYEEGGAE